MGCGGSKVNEEGISRCRGRKRAVKHAVRWRNQYAIAHTDYINMLKNLSTAFRHFTDGEFREQLNLSSGSSSSSTSTPVPATPTTPPLKKFDQEEEEIVRTVKLPPMALRSKPSDPITVVVSPPRSPQSRFTRRKQDDDEEEEEEDEAYQRYMENDAPPDGLYSDIVQPGKPRGTTTSSSSYYYTSGSGGDAASSSSSDYYSGYSSFMMPDSAPSWDIFGIFHMPPMMHQFQVVEEDDEELKKAMEDEDVPPLESASPDRDRDDDDEHDHLDEDDERQQEKHEDEQRHDRGVHDQSEGKKKKKVEDYEEEEEVKVVEEEKPKKNKQKEKEKEKEKEIVIENDEEEEEEAAAAAAPGGFKDVPSSSGTTAYDKIKIEEIFDSPKELDKEEDPVPESAAPPPSSPPVVPSNKDLEVWEVLRKIDDMFLRASECGTEVSRLLEARKVNHNNSGGLSERSARIFRAVSRSQWSPRTPLSFSEDSSSEDFGGVASRFAVGGHGATLEKLYAWERKLYVEVKENDSISSEFERKCKLLKKLDSKGASNEQIDKTRVAIKMLETQMQVSMHAMKATSQRIQELTDKELFPQLLEQLEATMLMWKNMYSCHQQQRDASERMKTPASPPLEATSKTHRQATAQLLSALNEWHRVFESFIHRQKEYMRNLNSWLRLSIYTPDRNSKLERRPPVHSLCQAWFAALDRFQEHELVEAIKTFAEMIHNIVRQQEEEVRAQKRAEVLAKELSKKSLSLNNLEKKLVGDGAAVEEAKASLQEKRFALEEFRKKAELEREGFTRAMQITRKMTLEILQVGLPPLFRSLDKFSGACLHEYRELNHKARNRELDTE